MTSDRDAIESAVQAYLDGLFEGDAGKPASVFHPGNALPCEQDGVLTPVPRDEWLETVRGRAAAKARGLEGHDQILQIDHTSRNTAFVKLKCQIPPRLFIDFLCFPGVDRKWQVAQKVLATEIHK